MTIPFTINLFDNMSIQPMGKGKRWEHGAKTARKRKKGRTEARHLWSLEQQGRRENYIIDKCDKGREREREFILIKLILPKSN